MAYAIRQLMVPVVSLGFVLFAILCAGLSRANAQTASSSAAATVAVAQPNSPIASVPTSVNVPAIFDVRRNLPLEPNEPVYKDFYITAGAEAGFKKGQYIQVTRAIPVYDPVLNRQHAVLNIGVGWLQVIHAEYGITVARLQTTYGDLERPTLEFEGIMIGDRIDMTSMTMKAPAELKKAEALAPEVKAPVAKAEITQPEAAPAPAPTTQKAENPSPELAAPVMVRQPVPPENTTTL